MEGYNGEKKILKLFIILTFTICCFSACTINNKSQISTENPSEIISNSQEIHRDENSENIQNMDNVDYIQKIELPYSESREYIIEGDFIYAAALRTKGNPDTLTDSIVKYSISKGETVDYLYKSEHYAANVQSFSMNDRWAVWCDSDPFCTYAEVYVLDRLTGNTEMIFSSDIEMNYIQPALYDNYIAWTTLNNDGGADIMLYDLANKELVMEDKIAAYYLHNFSPKMTNGKLIWTDTKVVNEKKQGLFVVYDIKNKEKKEIIAPKEYPGYIEVAGNLVYSFNHEGEPTNFYSQIFGVLDLNTEKFKVIEPLQYKVVDWYCVNEDY